jgi:hypothetical protein
VLARRFTAGGRRGWAAYSRVTGVVFLAAFAGVAVGSGHAPVTMAFIAAILSTWAWLAAVSIHYYRTTTR